MTSRLRWSAGLGLIGLLVGAMAGCHARQDVAHTRFPHVVDLDGHRVDPLRSEGAPATVFLFTRDDCPISNRYAPEIQRLRGVFESQGVRFRLVYPDPDATAASIREHLAEYGHDGPALRDPRHELVRWAEVRVTPEAAVMAADGRIVYRGRIDDQWLELGRARPEPVRRDLEEALTAVLADEPVATPRTEAVGCFIADLR